MLLRLAVSDYFSSIRLTVIPRKCVRRCNLTDNAGGLKYIQRARLCLFAVGLRETCTHYSHRILHGDCKWMCLGSVHEFHTFNSYCLFGRDISENDAICHGVEERQ